MNSFLVTVAAAWAFYV